MCTFFIFSFHCRPTHCIPLLIGFPCLSLLSALNVRQTNKETKRSNANHRNKLRGDECKKPSPMALFPSSFHVIC